MYLFHFGLDPTDDAPDTQFLKMAGTFVTCVNCSSSAFSVLSYCWNMLTRQCCFLLFFGFVLLLLSFYLIAWPHSWNILSSVGTMYIHVNSVCIEHKRAPVLMAQQSLAICLRIDFNIWTSLLWSPWMLDSRWHSSTLSTHQSSCGGPWMFFIPILRPRGLSGCNGQVTSPMGPSASKRLLHQ